MIWDQNTLLSLHLLVKSSYSAAKRGQMVEMHYKVLSVAAPGYGAHA